MCVSVSVCMCMHSGVCAGAKCSGLRRSWAGGNGLANLPETLLAYSCHAPVQTDNQTGKLGGLISLLSLSIEWLSRFLVSGSGFVPLSPDHLSFSRTPQGWALDGLCGQGGALLWRKVAGKDSNRALAYPWEGSRSSQESCLYVCFLN